MTAPGQSQDARQRAVEAQVAAIIRASGGWNARARARLAFYAATRRIETWRIRDAVRRIAAGPAWRDRAGHGAALPASGSSAAAGLPSTKGAAAGPAAAHTSALRAASTLPARAHTAAAEGAAGFLPERGAPLSTHGSISPVPAPSAAGTSLRSAPATWLTGVALALGVGASVALVWLAVDRVERARTPAAAEEAGRTGGGHAREGEAPNTSVRAPDAGGAAAHAQDATARAEESRHRGSSGHPLVPQAGARTVPPAPAIFPQPPALAGERAPRAVREALETWNSTEAVLERAVARRGALDSAEREALERAWPALLECWPVLERQRSARALANVAWCVAHSDPGLRETIRGALRTARDDTERTRAAWWRGSAAAALLATGEADGADADRLAGAALAWLQRRAPDLALAATQDAPGSAADLCDGLIAALDAASAAGGARETADAVEDWRGVARDAAVLAAVEAFLRGSAALDRPGIPASALGSLLDALPWTGSFERRERLGERWRAWMAEPALSARALHGLTSVLATRRPDAWWDPWMVVDARATLDERAAAGERLAAAIRIGAEEAAGDPDPGPRGVGAEARARWLGAHERTARRAVPRTDAERVTRAAEWMALVEAARALERGRASDADARLAQIEDPAGLMPAEGDRWRDGAPAAGAPRLPATDGTLDGELRRTRALEDRLAVLRSLRTRPIRDLGPRDAETLAREALASPVAQMRSVAQSVVVDVFGEGPVVLAALLAETPSAASPAELAQLAGALAGVPAPRGADATLRAAAALLIADRLAGLLPSERHATDAVTRELALSASAAARMLGGEVPALARPEDAMRAWAAARAADTRRMISADDLRAIQARASALRRAAASGPQRFVADQVQLLDVEAALVAARMPRRRADAQAVVQRAASARSGAGDVLEQIESNARALADMAALALGCSSETARGMEDPRSDAEKRGAASGERAATIADPRLAGLDSAYPLAYLERAEDIADAAATGPDGEADRALAIQLAARAGALDLERLGRSAALLIADLSRDGAERARMTALAAALSGESPAVEGRPDSGAVLSLVQALTAYRRGQGARARAALDGRGVAALLDAHPEVLPGGAERFRADCERMRDGLSPVVSPAQEDALLALVVAALAAEPRTWSEWLALRGHAPLPDFDLTRPEELFGVFSTERARGR